MGERTKCRECNCSEFVGNFMCISCDGKYDEHEVLYEDEETRVECGKAVGESYYPLSDVPDIQREFLRQVEEEEERERKKQEEQQGTTVAQLEKGLEQVAITGQETGDGQVSTLESRSQGTLPARDQPERSVRLMMEQGMLRKY